MPRQTGFALSHAAITADLLDSLFEGVYFVDRERRITYWNRGAEEITGYTAGEVVGRSCSDNILMHVDARGVNLCISGCPLSGTMSEGIRHEAEVFLHHKDGHRVPVALRAAPIRDAGGNVIGAVEAFTDISARSDSAQKLHELKEMALFDSLTRLGNRRYGEMNLQARFDEMQRYGWPFGVLFIDIDDFKRINDTYGHDIGDQVLRMVGRTLAHNVRSFDFMSRWGGEEFLGIILNVNRGLLLSVANKLRSLVVQSGFPVGSDILRVTVSIGATIAIQGDTPDTVVKRADILMYQSKHGGKNLVTLG